MSLKNLIGKVNTLANQNKVQKAVNLLMTVQIKNENEEDVLDNVIDDVEFDKIIDGSIINIGNKKHNPKYVKSHGAKINRDLTTANITKSDVFKITRTLKKRMKSEIVDKPEIVLP